MSSKVPLLLPFSATTTPRFYQRTPPDWHLNPLCFHRTIKPMEELQPNQGPCSTPTEPLAIVPVGGFWLRKKEATAFDRSLGNTKWLFLSLSTTWGGQMFYPNQLPFPTMLLCKLKLAPEGQATPITSTHNVFLCIFCPNPRF